MKKPIIDSTWYHCPADIRQRTSAGGIIVRSARKKLWVAFAREADFPLYVLPKGGVKNARMTGSTRLVSRRMTRRIAEIRRRTPSLRTQHP